MNGRIHIDGLMVECIIGCWPSERVQPQSVRVDLWVELDVTRPAETDNLSQTWNYAALAEQVAFILQTCGFYLLESAGRVLLRYLLLPPGPDEDRPAVTAAGVSLSKFGVLPGEAVPRLALSGDAATQEYPSEPQPWGGRDVVDCTQRLRLCRLNVSAASGLSAQDVPGSTMPLTGTWQAGRCQGAGSLLNVQLLTPATPDPGHP